MGAPVLFLRRTVEDAAVDLVGAAHRLQHVREQADRIVAELEARWNANRVGKIKESQKHP